ncbi:hypothetical protein QMT40_002849 [Parvibaculaceae bacterium PLY_AMNH_Bact1]|nr:hypothetical protein QMT40_002849 [Parvibaculaceae bacterium PLY_AMNH_Bact1]
MSAVLSFVVIGLLILVVAYVNNYRKTGSFLLSREQIGKIEKDRKVKLPDGDHNIRTQVPRISMAEIKRGIEDMKEVAPVIGFLPGAMLGYLVRPTVGNSSRSLSLGEIIEYAGKQGVNLNDTKFTDYHAFVYRYGDPSSAAQMSLGLMVVGGIIGIAVAYFIIQRLKS